MKVLLVERRSPGQPSRMEELCSLARTLGYEVKGKVEQIREPDPAYQIGEGKAREVSEMVRKLGVQKVIFGNPLTAAQAFRLSQMFGVEVIDRLQLILDIFAMRAGTPEAKLQVEYARLRYELPRARERVRQLLSTEQPGRMGRGEYEVNIYYDTIRRRLTYLKRKLADISKRRELKRKLRRRRGFRLVTLAGYTNAGKSTLLNALTHARAEVDNMMFTTLTTRTRAIKAAPNLLLTDTVGFIEDLPPWMVEAFKATLEEIYLSDLVVLVLDCSDPLPELCRKAKSCLEILSRYGVKIIIALNKIDLLSPEELKTRIDFLNHSPYTFVPISAARGENLEALMETIRQKLLH
ncbi:MAG: GTPase HflX [Candidatus Hadarchaeales archaeon]